MDRYHSLQPPPHSSFHHFLENYLAKSDFLINISSNDYINNHPLPRRHLSSHIYSGEAYADLLINNLSNQLLKLYRLGAKKMVLVGIGPLGCIPSQLSMESNNDGCIEQVNKLVSLLNSRLIQLTSALIESFPRSIFVYQNIYRIFNNMVTDPSIYGFTVSNSACCGNGRYGGDLTFLPLEQPCKNRDQYIFWDSFHPTQVVNAMMAESCYTESGTECYPISIYQLAQL